LSLTNLQLAGKGRKNSNPSKQRSENIVKGWNPRKRDFFRRWKKSESLIPYP
jgi:hypothetical protein